MTARGLRNLTAVVLAALACDEPTRIARAGGMALQVSVSDVDFSVLDSGRVRVRGPTNRDVSAVPGAVITIDQLQPGSYSVALEGFIGDAVGFFGQTSGVTVVAGQNTPATVTFASFESAAPVFPDTLWIGTQVTVNIAAVTGATGYRVEWSQDATFTSGVTSASTVTLSVQVTVATYAVYYIRVRAVDPFQMVGVPGAATRLRVVQSGPARQLQFSGQPSTTAAGSVIAPAVAVTAQDSLGNTATGFTGDVTVAIGTNPGGGALAGMTTVSATAGIATFATLSIDGAGVGYTLVASSGMLTAAVSAPFEITAGAATQIALDAGNNQTATVNTAVAIPPSVIVRDAGNNPVAGVSVTFAVASGGGSVTGATAATNASGIAAVGSWTLGTAAGTANNTLTATAAGLTGSPVTFTASAAAGAATQMVLQAGNNQTATVNTAVAVPPAVIVRDAFNNPVAGVSVSFAVVGGGGSVTGGNASTATDGVGRVGSWTLGTAAGTSNNILTATSPGLAGSPVTFTASATAGAATQLVFASQPTDVLARATIAPAVSVAAQDNFGNAATSFGGTVSMAIGTNPPGTGVLSGTVAVAAASGIAAFSDLSIDQAGTGYTLTATAAGVSSAISTPFDVTLQLVFAVEPTSTLADAEISPAVRVAARDALNNTATGFAGSITVAIVPGTGTPGATLSGTTTVAATAGEATFADLSIDFGGGGLGAGSGYRLTATAPGLSSTTSVEFTVSLRLVFTVQPTTTPNATVIAPPIQVAAQGVTDRTDTSFGGFVTMQIATGTGTAGASLAGTPTVAADRGVATFSDLSIDLAGTAYQLRAAGVGFLGDGYSDPFDVACVSDCWTTRAPMPTPRSELGVGVVNGILYAVGGSGAAEYATVEAYDPTSDSWTTKAPMPASRQSLAVGVVDGILYAVGGFSGSWLATVEAYDPVTNAWTSKAPMPTARANLSVAVVNGILYAIGGHNGTTLATVEAYDPVTNTWATKAPMPTARFRLGVGVVGGIVYAVRGNPGFYTVEAYDPVADSWTTRASAQTFRQEFGTGVVNGMLYTVGGYNTNTVEAYDPASDTWGLRASLSAPRSSAGVGIVNGVLYAVGGWDGGAVARVESYQP